MNNNSIEVCPECDGLGLISIYKYGQSINFHKYVTCFVCNGNKKITWIDKIKGAKKYLDDSVVHTWVGGSPSCVNNYVDIIKIKGIWNIKKYVPSVME